MYLPHLPLWSSVYLTWVYVTLYAVSTKNKTNVLWTRCPYQWVAYVTADRKGTCWLRCMRRTASLAPVYQKATFVGMAQVWRYRFGYLEQFHTWISVSAYGSIGRIHKIVSSVSQWLFQLQYTSRSPNVVIMANPTWGAIRRNRILILTSSAFIYYTLKKKNNIYNKIHIIQ